MVAATHILPETVQVLARGYQLGLEARMGSRHVHRPRPITTATEIMIATEIETVNRLVAGAHLQEETMWILIFRLTNENELIDSSKIAGVEHAVGRQSGAEYMIERGTEIEDRIAIDHRIVTERPLRVNFTSYSTVRNIPHMTPETT